MNYVSVEQPELNFTKRTNYRKGGTATSKAAGASVAIRAGSQRHKLLLSYAKGGEGGLTDEQAGDLCGLSQVHKCNYWSRCSELRAYGLIEPTGETRLSSVNEHQMVCKITPRGTAKLTEVAGGLNI